MQVPSSPTATSAPPAPAAGPRSDVVTFIERSSLHHLRIVAAFGLLTGVLWLTGLAIPAAYFALLGVHLSSAVAKVLLARRLTDDGAQGHFTALYALDVVLTTAAMWIFGAERWVGAGAIMLSVMMACAALRPRGRLVVTATACLAWAAVPLAQQAGLLPLRWIFPGVAPGAGDAHFSALVAGVGVICIAAVTLQLHDVMDLFQRQSRRVVDQERRWRALVEVSVNVVWTMDGDGIVREPTPAFLAFTGFTPEQARGTGFLDAVHPDDVERVVHEHRAAFRARRPYHVHHRMRRADGTWREVEAHVVPIVGHDGRIAEWVGAHTDVTDGRRLEAQLRQAQKMEAVGQLAGGIAHDFNNLLAAISTNLELALDALPPGHEAREDIGEARGASARAAELTRQLLAFGRPQQAAPRVVSVNDVLAGAERLLRSAAGETEFSLALSPDAGAVLADPGQLEQVAMNLVVNARDAVDGRADGEVTVETGVVRQGRGAGQAPAAWATITVRDNGCGMSESTQRRIFEPFFTTKPTGQGSGLGLASVYAIVERAGGEVSVESAPGRGTTMTVRLPRVGEPPPSAGVRVDTPPGAGEALRRGRILLVEDEAPVRTSLRRMLERQGHVVVEARHGADALLQVERQPGAFDLVLTDVLMPGMGGPELAAVLAELAPGLPVLFMSGYTGDAEQTRGIPEDALLVKPFTSDALRAHVAKRLR